VVSIRVGDVRRQAPLKKLKNHTLAFPCALDKAAEEPMKIEVLSPEAAELVVLRPSSARYKVPLSSVSSNMVVGTTGTTEEVSTSEPVGAPMTLDIHLGKVGSLPPRSKSRSGSLGTAGQSTNTCTSTGTYEAAATSAREYLETHKLLQYMQVMLRAVAEKQPEDPFAYMKTRMQMDKGDILATTIPETPLDDPQVTNSEAGSPNFQGSSEQLQVADDPNGGHSMIKTVPSDALQGALHNDKVLSKHKPGEDVSLPCPVANERSATNQSPSAVTSPAGELGGAEKVPAAVDSSLSCPAAARPSHTSQVTVADDSNTLSIDDASSRPAPTQPIPKSQESETVIQANTQGEAGATGHGPDSPKATMVEGTDGTFDDLRLLCKQKLCDYFERGELKTLLQNMFRAPGAAGTDVHASSPLALPQIHAANRPPPDGKPAMLQLLQQQQQQQQLTQEEVMEAVKRLKTDVRRRTCVCILGGKVDANSETLVAALAHRLGKKHDDNVAFVTNGLQGVQTVFAQNLGSARLWQLAHTSSPSDSPKFGEVLVAGDTFEQQKTIFASLGDVYVTVAGGQGVAYEAGIAYARGALIVPLVRTGGASAGESNFPKETFVRPSWASTDDWEMLRNTSADVELYADAVARIVWAAVSEARRDDQSPPVGKAVAEPPQSAHDCDASWEARDKEITDIQDTMNEIQKENRELSKQVEALERRLLECHPEKTQLLATQPSTR